MKETEELHQKLFKTVPDLIIRTDTQGNILLVNERALSHYHIASKEEVVGKNILSFIVEEDKEYAITNIRLMHEQPQGLKEYRISPQIGQLQNIPTASFEFWVQKHIDGENLHIEDIHELPENNLKKFMRSTGITSLLTIPLWNHKKECVGFIGFDSEHETHRFGVTEQHLLEVYAQMLVNVMERRESENLIRQNLIEKNVLLAEIHHRGKRKRNTDQDSFSVSLSCCRSHFPHGG